MSKKSGKDQNSEEPQPPNDEDGGIISGLRHFSQAMEEALDDFKHEALAGPDAEKILQDLSEREKRSNTRKPQYGWEQARDRALAEMGPPIRWEAPAKRQLCAILETLLQDQISGRPDISTIRRKVNEHPMFDEFRKAALAADKL